MSPFTSTALNTSSTPASWFSRGMSIGSTASATLPSSPRRAHAMSRPAAPCRAASAMSFTDTSRMPRVGTFCGKKCRPKARLARMEIFRWASMPSTSAEGSMVSA